MAIPVHVPGGQGLTFVAGVAGKTIPKGLSEVSV